MAGLFLWELYSTGLLQIGEFGEFQKAGRLNFSLKPTFRMKFTCPPQKFELVLF